MRAFALTLLLASLPAVVLADDLPRRDAGQNQYDYIHSPDRDRELKALKGAPLLKGTLDDSKAKKVQDAFLAEIEQLLATQRETSAAISDEGLYDLSTATTAAELDSRIRIVNRYLDSVSANTPEAWVKKFRDRLATAGVTPEGLDRHTAEFARGIQEGFRARIKGMGYATKTAYESNLEQDRAELSTWIEVFELLKSELGRWTYDKGAERLVFESKSAEDKFEELSKHIASE